MKCKLFKLYSLLGCTILVLLGVITMPVQALCQQLEQNTKGEWVLFDKDGSSRILDPNNYSDLKILNAHPEYNKKSYLAELADKITQDIRETENKVQLMDHESEKLRINKNLLEQSLRTEKSDMSEQQQNEARRDINILKIHLAYYKKEQALYRDEIEQLKQLLRTPGPKQIEGYRLFCLERDKKHKPPPALTVKPLIQHSKKSNAVTNTQSSGITRKSAEDYAQYDASKDVMLSPPDRPCAIEYEGKDEFMGRNRKDHSPQMLFFYTPEQLNSVYTNTEYLSCRAALSSVSGGSVFLNLYFDLATKDAGRLFGGFDKGSVIHLKFLDGDNFAIINNRNDPGIYDPASRTMVFRAQCNLGAGVQDKIASKPLDKIRVSWQTGYEDYEVFDVDLLIRQSKCIR